MRLPGNAIELKGILVRARHATFRAALMHCNFPYAATSTGLQSIRLDSKDGGVISDSEIEKEN